MLNKAIDLLQAAKSHGISIALNNEQLQLKVPKDKNIDPSLLDEIRNNKQLLIDYLGNLSMKLRSGEAVHTIHPVERNGEELLRLSFAQERLWFIHQLQGSVQYHLPYVFRVQGNPDIKALQWAFKKIIERHEVLRSVIQSKDGLGYQMISAADNWQLEEVHQAEVITAHGGLQQYIGSIVDLPFNLQQDAMMKVTLIHVSAQEYLLIILLHHIAFDGLSIGILMEELVELYRSYIAHRHPVLNDLPIQYSDFAAWQRNYLSGQLLSSKLDYWKQQLNGVERMTLPVDRARTAKQTVQGGSCSRMVSKDILERLEQFSLQEGTTLFMTLLAAFKVLMQKYSGQNDICIGSPIAGRRQQEVEKLIGLFVNTLVLRSEVNPQSSFKELLQQVKQNTLLAYEHQDLPFEKIVEALGIEREAGRNPLYDVLFTLKDGFGNIKAEIDGLSISQETAGPLYAQFDLNFNLIASAEGLQLYVVYASALYNAETIERMLMHYEQLLCSVLENRHASIASLSLLNQQEEEQLIVAFNNTQVEYPNTNVIALFKEQVLNNPAATALLCGEEKLSYRQLDRYSDNLAGTLRHKGVKAEVLVPICMHRSIDMVISILAVLKAGGAYVPIDPSYPAARIEFILQDTRAAFVLTNTDSAAALPADTIKVFIDEEWGQIDYSGVDIRATQLAYIIYTSGSTGNPKGVMIEHGSLINYILNAAEKYTTGAAGSFLHLPFTFDASITSIFLPLVTGGSIVLATKTGTEVFTDALFNVQQPYEFIKLTPSHIPLLEAMVNNGTVPAKRLVVGGEALQPAHLKFLVEQQADVTIINEYGPTEATVGCAVYSFNTARGVYRTGENGLLIGKPIDNVQLYVLDAHNKLVPIGVPGELCIGGAQLARGYWNQAELTKEKFIDNPFIKGYKIYKTGDIARWLPDGNLEYLGRRDDQVKIRGYRVELGEVEAALSEVAGVLQCAVAVNADSQSNKRLTAYVVTNESYNQDQTIEFLQSRLPEYMIPSLLLQIEALPLTSNGKVDRKKLLELSVEIKGTAAYVAPRNETEIKLAVIWQELLEIEIVGVHDDFFSLGGHSLLAIRVIAAIRNEFGKELSIKDLFDHATIAGLAVLISDELIAESLPAIQRVKDRQQLPLSFAQERLWFIDQLNGSVQYHMPWVFRLKGKLNVAALEESFKEIVRRHEVLRTVIKENDGVGYQVVLPWEEWTLTATDFSIESVDQEISKYINAPFDLSTDFMLKVWLIERSVDEHILITLFHHIAFDGWSISIMVKELEELYASKIESRSALLRELPVQYSDYAAWQRKHLTEEVLNTKLNYWKDQLTGIEPLELPTDHVRPAIQSMHGAVIKASIDKRLTAELHQLSQAEGATLFMTLCAAFNILLYKYTGQQDICIGTPTAGRQQKEVEELIGFFVNTLALRNKLDEKVSFRQLLGQVKQTTLHAYEHQDVPFERIVEVLGVQRDLSRTPVFQVMFALQNMPAADKLRLGEVELSAMRSGFVNAKFDIGFNITELDEELQLDIIYCADLFEETTMNAMLRHYEQLLHSIVNASETTVARLSILNASEQEQILQQFSNLVEEQSRISFSLQGSLDHQLQTGGADIAIEYKEQHVSYTELQICIGKINWFLRKKLSLAKGEKVIVLLNRSEKLVLTALAVLRSGLVYVPIDTSYPADRVRYMIEDARPAVIITDETQEFEGVQSISIHEILSAENTGLFFEENINPSDEAYIIYTSGSTGAPKGVVITHGNLDHLFEHIYIQYIHSKPVLPFTASHSFDISLLQLYLPLLSGGTVLVVDHEQLRDIEQLVSILEQATIIDTVPGLYKLIIGFIEEHKLVARFQHIERLFVGGDFIPDGLLNQLSNIFPNAIVTVLYGPTEGTLFCTHLPYEPGSMNANTKGITIGRPIGRGQIYVLGRAMELLPAGVEGEICIGGAGVSKGYLNQKQQTAQKYVVNPYRHNELLYRTGDLGRWTHDGLLQFRGRNDNQVKIRGNRIELGELENKIKETAGVEEAVVVAVKQGQAEVYLAAFYTGEEKSREEFETHLRKFFAEAVLPAHYIRINEVPLTANAKVDRKKLQALAAELAHNDKEYVAPRNEAEHLLAAVWHELLGVELVGIHDNFFELGGHSLLAIRMIASIRKKTGFEVNIKDVFNHPTIERLANYLSVQINAKLPAITKCERNKPLCLSFAQERLWFIDKLQGSIQYHLPWVFRLKGELDVDALESACKQLLNRHEVLRTVICEEEGIGYQLITDAGNWKLNRIHFSTIQGSLQQYVEDLLNTPFDLCRDTMLKLWLIQLSEQEYVLVLLMHHIASDAWSMNILAHELRELYCSAIENRAASLNELPVQYADYAVWQRNYLSGQVLDRKLAYWKNKLGNVQPLELPTDHARPAVQSVEGAVVTGLLNTALVQALEGFSKQHGATLFMTLLSAFKLLLYKYTGQSDICIGSPIAGRQLQEIEGTIGFFVNTLALRDHITPGHSFKQILQQVTHTTLEAYEQQDVPFEKIVEVLGVQRDMSRTPVFQVMFSLQNAPQVEGLNWGGLILETEKTNRTTAQFDINLSITPKSGGCELALVYCKALFDESSMKRMLSHYTGLLKTLLTNYDANVEAIGLLDKDELHQLIVEFNDTAVAYPKQKTVVDLFEEQVLRTPDAVALVFEEQQLTYRELNERSNQLANYLQRKGVKQEMLVPVCVDRSLDMLIAIFGIWKTGAAYVPVDPSHPSSRIGYMLEDSKATIAVCHKTYAQFFADTELIVLEEVAEKIAAEPTTYLSGSSSSHNLSYLIYTSGSTGQPKGVMIEHKSLLNFLLSMQSQLQLREKDSTIAITTYSFDISCLELYLSLIIGGTVHIASQWQVKDGYALRSLVEKASPDFMQATPPGWQLLLESGWQNREGIKILTGGEAIADGLKETLTSISRDVFNMYGPTETTIWSAMQRLEKGKKVSIGKPIANTQMYIFNTFLQPCPIGVYGELCIGGDGLSRGYLNKEELTSEKFIDNPFVKGEKIYRTGDVARWNADGTLEYLGRKDEQVKVRGYRIELGEIETVLNRAQGVEQGVVVAVKDSSGSNQLIAYVVSNEGFDKAAALSYMRSYLPEYMIPALFAEIEQMPLTPNGKVDRKKLREQDVSVENVAYEAPRNETEETLVSIWQELLPAPQISIHDNFFEVGGHSLLAMRMVSMIRKKLNREVAIREIFLHPTIAQLGEQIKDKEQNLAPAIERYERTEQIPLSFSQERLWFIDQLQGSLQYHMPYVFRLKGDLNIPALEASFREIVNRHEILRTVIRQDDGIGYQFVLPAHGWKINQLSEAGITTQYNSVQQFIEAQVAIPFNLGNDFMLKVWVIKLSTHEHILFALVHHIAFDGWSIGIMVDELVKLYRANVLLQLVALDPLPVQYADYAIWQRKYLSGEVLDKKLTYWKEQLKEVTPLELPTDFARPAIQSMNGAIAGRTLDKSLVRRLHTLCREEGVTLFMTMLSSFNVLLHKYTGQSQICVGSPVAGRNQQDIEGLIGFFINTIALRAQVDGHTSFVQLLQQVKQTTLDAYDHQDVPFEKIVEALDVTRDMRRTPVFQVMFMLQNLPDAGSLEFANLSLQSENTDLVAAKFDLTLGVSEIEEGLRLDMTYCTDLYNRQTIERMLLHYEQLLHEILEDKTTAIADLKMMASDEKHQLLYEFNNTAVPYPDTTVLSLFRVQVQSNPSALALVCGNENISYAALDERSGKLAAYLRNKGVKAETMVPVFLERSAEMIVSILGVLKAGGAYVPIDPSYPQNRINYILQDTGAKIVLTTEKNKELLPATTENIAIDTIWNELASMQAYASFIHSSQLAYIIYTSGSTGNPKGVMIEHRSLANYLLNSRSRYIGEGDGTFFHLPFTFDASVTSIFVPLIAGKSIVIGAAQGAEAFADPLFCRYATYDFIKLTPAHLKLLEAINIDEKGLTKRFIVGGEALQPAHFSFLTQSKTDITIINEYGPTEATVGCSVYSFNTATGECRTGENGVLIGKPLDNVKLYIIDQYNKLVPVGVYGELCIGGVQVARGYLNQPALTQEKFMQNHFIKGERIYKTGDIVRWLPDGNLEYFGRKDEQVKIKGYRIEIGEIELALNEAPGVLQAVVTVQEDKQGSKRLVGYVVPRESFNKQNIIGYLQGKLPEYMMPSVLLEVKEIPLTANGKTDKKKLQELVVEAAGEKEHVAARNEREQALIDVWQELLGVEKIGIHDNFFELGGDSIITIQVVSRMKRKGYELQPKDLFQHQTIARLSVLIDERKTRSIIYGEQGLLQGNAGLLPIQQWFFENASEDISHYNQSIIVAISKNVDVVTLNIAVQHLIEQHDALRFKYQHNQTGWQQKYGHKIASLFTEDLSLFNEDLLPNAIKMLSDRYQRSLDIEKAELVKFVLIQTPEAESHHRLLIIIHHLAIDGVSWRILLEDITQLLDQHEAGVTLSLGKKGSSYREWFNALEAYSNSKSLLSQQPYWNSIIEEFVPLPVDLVYEKHITQNQFGHCSATLSKEYTQKLLQQVPRVYHTEVNDVLLAALARTLVQWNRRATIVIGMEAHGREEIANNIDISRTAGWFTSLYPVLLSLEGLNTEDELLKSIKEQLRRIPEKGIGYGVLRYINKETSLQGLTPWEIVFNYLGQTGNALGNKWFAPASESSGNGIGDGWKQTNKMEVISIVQDGELRLRWNYSTKHYYQSTIETLTGQYMSNLEMLIDHCMKRSESGPVFTPSDYGLSSEISFKELDAFLEKKDSNLDEVMSF